MAEMTISNRKVGSITRQRRMKRRRSDFSRLPQWTKHCFSNVEVYPAEKMRADQARIAFRQCRAPSCALTFKPFYGVSLRFSGS